ncbi:hypothetical protein COSO111634_37450 [Corallococcus soli]
MQRTRTSGRSSRDVRARPHSPASPSLSADVTNVNRSVRSSAGVATSPLASCNSRSPSATSSSPLSPQSATVDHRERDTVGNHCSSLSTTTIRQPTGSSPSSATRDSRRPSPLMPTGILSAEASGTHSVSKRLSWRLVSVPNCRQVNPSSTAYTSPLSSKSVTVPSTPLALLALTLAWAHSERGCSSTEDNRALRTLNGTQTPQVFIPQSPSSWIPASRVAGCSSVRPRSTTDACTTSTRAIASSSPRCRSLRLR